MRKITVVATELGCDFSTVDLNVANIGKTIANY